MRYHSHGSVLTELQYFYPSEMSEELVKLAWYSAAPSTMRMFQLPVLQVEMITVGDAKAGLIVMSPLTLTIIPDRIIDHEGATMFSGECHGQISVVGLTGDIESIRITLLDCQFGPAAHFSGYIADAKLNYWVPIQGFCQESTLAVVLSQSLKLDVSNTETVFDIRFTAIITDCCSLIGALQLPTRVD